MKRSPHIEDISKYCYQLSLAALSNHAYRRFLSQQAKGSLRCFPLLTKNSPAVGKKQAWLRLQEGNYWHWWRTSEWNVHENGPESSMNINFHHTVLSMVEAMWYSSREHLSSIYVSVNYVYNGDLGKLFSGQKISNPAECILENTIT